MQDAADRDFNRAIALAPSYSCADESRDFFAIVGRRDEAFAEFRSWSRAGRSLL
jgi:hypothetical protein